MSEDLQKRLNEHNSGKTKSTKPFVPWVIFHTESFSISTEARLREKYFKSAAGRRWRKIIYKAS
jgi:putative endonuclease